MNQATPNTRYEFLDWLRVLAIFLLLFFHTGMLFVGWGWHITNAETIPALELPMDLAHRLRMPLLFVIAGAGMWFALKRRTGKAFIAERTWRLLVPAIIGMFLIVPPQVFLERVAHGQWSGGYLDFMWQRVFRFEPYPAGDFSWHHLWFIIYLYVYVLLLVPLLLWWRRARPELRPGVWMYALALPLGNQRSTAQAAVPRVAQPRPRLVHLHPLSVAHDLRLRARVDARRVGLVCAATALVAGAGSRGVARRFSRSSKPA